VRTVARYNVPWIVDRGRGVDGGWTFGGSFHAEKYWTLIIGKRLVEYGNKKW
jgi:hypothetical protein